MPNVPQTTFTEQLGVSAVVARAFEMKFVWRATPNVDVGIDGQFEVCLESGEVTSTLIAAQIKSGGSYFRWEGDVTYYTPSERHADYWRAFPLPVLLLLHEPETGNVYFADVRLHLRANAKEHPVKIPILRSDVFESANRDRILGSCGPVCELLTADDAAKLALEFTHRNPQFPLSFADLLLFGIVDIGNQLYFSMPLVCEIAELRLKFNKSDFGIATGYDEFEFLNKYVNFLVEQKLVYLDYTAYQVAWGFQEMVPLFIIPLTHRGKAVVRKLAEIASDRGVAHASSLSAERLILPYVMSPKKLSGLLGLWASTNDS